MTALALAGCSAASVVTSPTPVVSASPSVTSTASTPSATSAPTTATAAAPCLGAAPPLHYSHVVWIVMENKAERSVLGSSDAPYLNHLANRCGDASDYHAISHPSLPNYLALTSGST